MSSRVLVLPLNAEGHATPMMHLSCLLAKRGCSIVYVAMESSFARIQEKGTWPPSHADIQLEPLLPPPPGVFNYVNVTIGGLFEMIKTLKPQFEELVKKSLPLACIICDFHLDWVVDVAQCFNIPSAVLFTGNSTWNWLELQTPSLASNGIIHPASKQANFQNDIVLSEQPLLQTGDLPNHLAKPDDIFFQQLLHRNSTMWKKVTWVLGNSFDGCEKASAGLMKAELGDKYLTIGPLAQFNEMKGDWSMFVGHQKHDESSLQWLEKQVPLSVLYISFGSNASLSKHQYREIMSGVEASKQHFLWVIRSDVQAESWDFFEGFVDRTKDRGLVVSWCLQTQVLSHPAIAAFLTHSGWNSVQDALSNGQPMVCCPCEFDQKLNSKLVVELKVGIKASKLVKDENLDRKEVERLVISIMCDKSIQQNAKDLAEDIRSGISEGGSSFLNLNRFVADLLRSC